MSNRCRHPLRLSGVVFSLLNGAMVITQGCGGNDITRPAPAVTSAGPPAFALSAESANVLQGGDGELRIAIARNGGFTGPVTLAISGAPAGVSVSITPTTTTGTTATLTVTTAAAAAAGNVMLTITGSAAGRTDQITTAMVAIVRNMGGTGNVSIDVSACTAASKPIWFAVQDGTGPWTQIVGSSDVYRFNIASSKGGYAWVTRAGAGLTISLATRVELTASTISHCAAPVSGLKTVSGTLAGLGFNDVANIGMGGGWADPDGGPIATTSFTLSGVRAGNQDLIAYRTNPLGLGSDDRMIIRRDQNIPNGGAVGAIDFSSAESFAPAAATLTITGAGSSVGAVMMYGVGAECSAAVLSEWTAGGPSSTMRGVPAVRQRATDFHRVGVYTTSGDYRSASESFHTLADRVIALPPSLPTPTVSAPPGGHKRVQLALTLPPDYQTSLWLWYREQRGVGNGVDMYASFAWVGGADVALAIPDLSEVTGWKSSYLPTPDAPIVWGLYASGSSSATAAAGCGENARSFTTSVSGKA